MTEFQQGCLAMLNYIYNTSGEKFAEDIFPGRAEPYMAEKAQSWGNSPARAIGFLDQDNKLKLFVIIKERYGDAPL